MNQDLKWNSKWKGVMDFITTNKRNPSKYIDEERGLYVNWLRHNRKLYNAGELKLERADKFKELLSLSEQYKRKNQYE